MSKIIPSFRLLLFCCVGAFLVACTASPPRVSYYSLLGSTPQKVTDKRNETLVLNIGPVTLSGVLKRTLIATGGTDGRFTINEFHRWTSEVDREFSRALAEQLASRLGTEQVMIFPGDRHLDPNCQVQLDIVAMDGDLGKDAKMTVRWILVDPKGKWTPVSRLSQLSEHPADAGYGAWVIAQQQNISKLGVEIAIEVMERMKL